MAKTLLQYVSELKEIHDKQSQLALQEQGVMQEIAKFDLASNMKQIIAQHGTLTESAPADTISWNVNAKIDKKASVILKRRKHIMSNREVCEAIVEIEKNNDQEYLKFLIRKFSAVVGGKAKNGRTFRRIDVDGVFYFALPEWFGHDGDLIKQYDQPE